MRASLHQLHNVLHSNFAGHSTISVLDCGVGSGALSVALYKSGHENLTLVGVDSSPAMAIAARKHLAQHGVPMRIRTQDVRRLPYDDNAFSMVMAAHTIEHLPKPEVGIREMFRVLRPGAPLPHCHDATRFAGLTCGCAMGLNLSAGIHSRRGFRKFGPAQCAVCAVGRSILVSPHELRSYWLEKLISSI